MVKTRSNRNTNRSSNNDGDDDDDVIASSVASSSPVKRMRKNELNVNSTNMSLSLSQPSTADMPSLRMAASLSSSPPLPPPPLYRRSVTVQTLRHHHTTPANNGAARDDTFEREPPTHIGFANSRHQNLCYMNAALSGIFYSSHYLRQRMLSASNAPSVLVSALNRFAHAIDNNESVSVVQMIAFRKSLRKLGWSMYDDETAQQDSVDFLRFLFDTLQLEPFWQLVRRTLHSGRTEVQDTISESGCELMVEFGDGNSRDEQSLRTLILAALERQFIRVRRKRILMRHGDDDDVSGDDDANEPNAVQLRQFKETPNILLVSVKRYRRTRRSTTAVRLQIPLSVESSLHDLPGCEGDDLQLRFAVSHLPQGRNRSGLKGGHYVCHYQTADGEWYRHDDLGAVGQGRAVVPLREKQPWATVHKELLKNVYYLVYERSSLELPRLLRAVTEPSAIVSLSG